MSGPGQRDATVATVWLLTLAAIWGASFVFIKIALDDVPPLTIAAGRIALAAIVLVLVARFVDGRLRLARRYWLPLLGAAFFGNALPYSLIAFGEREIDAGLAAILMSTMPLFTIVTAQFLTDDERITPEKIVGLAIGFAGIVWLIGPIALADLGSDVSHQLMVAGGAAGYAVASVLSRRLTDAPKLPVAAVILALAALMIVPLSLALDRPWRLEPGLRALGAVIALGVVATAVAQLILLRVLQLRDATFLSLNNYFVPVFGVLWGMLLLGERPERHTFAALLIILLGVLVTRMHIGSVFTGRGR